MTVFGGGFDAAEILTFGLVAVVGDAFFSPTFALGFDAAGGFAVDFVVGVVADDTVDGDFAADFVLDAAVGVFALADFALEAAVDGFETLLLTVGFAGTLAVFLTAGLFALVADVLEVFVAEVAEVAAFVGAAVAESFVSLRTSFFGAFLAVPVAEAGCFAAFFAVSVGGFFAADPGV